MSTSEETRQDRIQRRLDQIVNRPDFPAFCEHVQAVLNTLNDEERSVRHITNQIIRDYALTLKVLRTANSFHYNRSGKPIHSVTHAIALLGLESVRSLTAGMMLVEHFQGKSAGLKELMLLSLLTANHAHLAAERVGFPRGEDAYLCGMYRNLGEVAAACYFRREYAELLLLIRDRKMTQRDAALRMFGFTLEELGEAVATFWRMSEATIDTMRPWEPSPYAGSTRPGDMLKSVTAFSHGLTTAVYRRDPHNARARVALLLEAYRPVLGLTEEDARKLAAKAIEDTRDTFQTLRVPVDDLRLRRQMAQALDVVASEPPLAGAAAAAPGAEHGSDEVMADLIKEIRAFADRGRVDLNALVQTVLEALCRGAGFDRAAFTLVNAEHSHVQARLALGEGSEDLLERFRFPLRALNSPVTAALGRRQDLFVQRVRDARFERSDLVRTLQPDVFGLLPVVVDGVVLGALYFDRKGGNRSVEFHRDSIMHLRDLLSSAIQRSRVAVPA